MAVRMPPGQNIFATSQRIEIIAVRQIPPGHLQVAVISGALPSQQKIFTQDVTLVPGVLLHILVVQHRRFGARDGSAGQVGGGRFGGSPQGIQSGGQAGKGVGIDQAAHYFVVGVSREPILEVKAACRIDGGRIASDQPINLRAGCLVFSGGVIARQRRHPLAEGRTRGESVCVVPSAKVRAGRGSIRT